MWLTQEETRTHASSFPAVLSHMTARCDIRDLRLRREQLDTVWSPLDLPRRTVWVMRAISHDQHTHSRSTQPEKLLTHQYILLVFPKIHLFFAFYVNVLYICMYICVYIYIHKYICMYINIYLFTYILILFIYISIYTEIYINIYPNIYLNIYICMYFYRYNTDPLLVLIMETAPHGQRALNEATCCEVVARIWTTSAWLNMRHEAEHCYNK